MALERKIEHTNQKHDLKRIIPHGDMEVLRIFDGVAMGALCHSSDRTGCLIVTESESAKKSVRARLYDNEHDLNPVSQNTTNLIFFKDEQMIVIDQVGSNKIIRLKFNKTDEHSGWQLEFDISEGIPISKVRALQRA